MDKVTNLVVCKEILPKENKRRSPKIFGGFASQKGPPLAQVGLSLPTSRYVPF